MRTFCPRAGCGSLDPLEIIRKDNGKTVQVCKHCGWDSEADEIFDDESDNVLNNELIE